MGGLGWCMNLRSMLGVKGTSWVGDLGNQLKWVMAGHSMVGWSGVMQKHNKHRWKGAGVKYKLCRSVM